MIKVFKENNRTTVVFPETDASKQIAIERILREVYNDTESTQEIEVKGLIPQDFPQDTKIQVISKEHKRTYKRQNSIINDKRNPFPKKTVYEALMENGISALSKYAGKFGNTDYDVQITREMFGDLKKYLNEHYTEDYLTNTELDIIKDIIITLGRLVVPDTLKTILRKAAMVNEKAFLKDGTEAQLRSAAKKLMSDTIKALSK